MAQLFAAYSVEQIFLFIVIVAIAAKQLITFLDWASERTTKQVDKVRKPSEIEQQLQKEKQRRSQLVQLFTAQIHKVNSTVSQLNDQIDLLVASDKDDIKAWITAQHHHFTEKGYIDYYSLDCINKRYSHYLQWGGNSFIQDLVNELNNLPTK